MINKIKLIIFLSTIFVANAFGSDAQIIDAIAKDKADVVIGFLNKGLDVNKIISGETLLAKAAKNNALCVAELLISKGAMVENIKPIDIQVSALSWGITKNNLLMTYLLLSRGATPKFVELLETLDVNEDFLKLLIEFGGDVNQRDFDLNATLKEILSNRSPERVEIIDNAEEIKKEGKLKQKLEKDLEEELKKRCKQK